MSRKVAVVTGAAGFLGSALCRRLLLENYRVIGLDNFSTGAVVNLKDLCQLGEFDMITGDVRQANSAAIDGRVDVVFHLASPASPIAYQRDPIGCLETGSSGTQQMLELATAKRAKFLLSSTSEVYGDPLVSPQTESYFGNVNPVGPRSMYDEAKRFSEALTTAYGKSRGLRVRIARIFNSYGPGMQADDGRVVPAFICQALRGESITVEGDGTQTRSMTYVDDTIEGLCRLMDSDASGPVNIGSDVEQSVLDIAVQVQQAVGGESARIELVAGRPEDPLRRRPSLLLAEETFGWTPSVRLEEGLPPTVEWFRSILDLSPGPTSAASTKAIGRARV